MLAPNTILLGAKKCICIYVLSYNKTSVSTVSALRSEKFKHTPYLPQCKVQVRGVLSGWRDINHCVAAQRRIRAIHAQPYPIMRIPF